MYSSFLSRALCALGACSVLIFGQAQTPSQTPTSDVIHVDVRLVNLLCTVREKSGAYVNDLAKEDFTVLEDGKPQTVTHFARQTDQPLTVALLFDVSFSMHASLSAETEAARQFFRNILRPGDGVSLTGFAAAVGAWQPVTSSRQELERALDLVPAVGEALKKGEPPYNISVRSQERTPSGGLMVMLGGDGGSRLYDAVDLISSQQLQRLPGRKAMIALTDGEDDGSQRTLKEAVRSALDADAIFFGINLKEGGGRGMINLDDLAVATGGNAYRIDTHMTLDAALRAIEEQLRNQYAIGYAPPEDGKKPAFHKVQVRMNRPGLKVSVRSGYYR
jgi:VWFA-related protein